MINMKKYDEVKIYKHIADRKNINQEVVVIDEHIDVEVDEFVTVEAFDYVNEKRVQIMFEIEALHKKYRTKKDSEKTEEKNDVVNNDEKKEVDKGTDVYVTADYVNNKMLENESFLFHVDDVREGRYVGFDAIYFTNIDTELYPIGDCVHYLNDALNDYDYDIDESVLIEIVQKTLFLIDVNVEECMEVEDERELIVFDYNDCKFYELNYYEKVKYVDHWNGNKLERLLLEGINELEVTRDYVSLDEFDGSDFYTKKRNEHQSIYKVKNTDDVYLIKKWDDFDGTLTACELLYYDDLYDYLDALGRDTEQYMSWIDEL